jgi:hypothetical protein
MIAIAEPLTSSGGDPLSTSTRQTEAQAIRRTCARRAVGSTQSSLPVWTERMDR